MREIELGEALNIMTNLPQKLRDQRGFNLIELMIVIAIIGLLIGVGTVGWQSMIVRETKRPRLNQMKQIQTLSSSVRLAKNKGKFASFDELISSVGLDETYTGENPVINGYVFTMTVEEFGEYNRPSIR